MPRNKVLQSSRTRVPVRLQDSSGLLEEILAAVSVTLIEPLVERIETLERLMRLQTSQAVQSFTIELPRRHGGHFSIAGVFAPEQIGAPVIMVQAPPHRFDEAEGLIVQFVAEVVSAHAMRVVWTARSIPPQSVRINYIIGTAQESQT